MFRPDQPIQSKNEDLLGRQAFSIALADAICSYQDKNSIVVGLYGAWGSGKTSIINMSLERIEAISKDKLKKERPVVIKFNPWNYSDQNQLISQFFKQLSAGLKKSDFADDAKKVGEQLEVYASFFEPLALISLPGVGVPAVILSKVFQLVGKASKGWGVLKSKELAEVKSDLNRLLKKASAKIIIVIDDIDRLNNIEIRQIFQLIKSLGDFPNTIYLLAFDKNVVINALKKVQEGSGREYLEKIVQIPFEVPLADKQEIERLLFSQLDQLIKDLPEDQWDQVYWGNIYHSGLKHFFENIRDVTRYVNALRLSFEMVRGEVNAIDFMAITGLQVFLPDVYAGIRDNKDLFAGASRDRGSQAQKDEDLKACENILSCAGDVDKEQLKDFLKRLFPRLESILGNMNYGSDWLDNWRKAGRICSPDIFDTFFRLSLPKNELSHKEILRVISASNDGASFADDLQNLMRQGKIIRFLERLEDYTKKDIPEDNIGNIISTLIDLGDTFPEGETGFFGFDTPLRILRITHQLLRRLDDRAKRFSILEEAFKKAEQSIFTIVHEVSVQDQEHGRYKLKDKPRPDEELTLPADYLDKLEKLACDKLTTWAKDGRLAKHKKLAGILYSWERWTKKEDVDGFVAELIKTDTGLIDFISPFLGKSTSHGMSDYVGKVHWRISLDNIKHFVDPTTFTDRVRKIARESTFKQLPEEKQKAIIIFLDTIDGKIKSDWDD
ncbi:MAG: AAA family ATPase [Candidatus Omnitrophica bacterium]|nr:AAA family ATPase [Candidatus Omnitrophota bacterium]